MLATALGRLVGYDKATAISKTGLYEGKTIRELATSALDISALELKAFRSRKNVRSALRGWK